MVIISRYKLDCMCKCLVSSGSPPRSPPPPGSGFLQSLFCDLCIIFVLAGYEVSMLMRIYCILFLILRRIYMQDLSIEFMI